MQNTLKHTLSAIVIIFFVILAIASATGKNLTISKESGQIPPNFEPLKDTLLVITNTIPGIGVGKTFRSAFKDYKAPHLLIKGKELEQYDTDKYKFELYLSHNPSNFTDEKGRPGPGTISCIMEERQTGKKYKSQGVPDFGRLLKNYVKTINKMTE